jgi:hypothetical protein
MAKTLPEINWSDDLNEDDTQKANAFLSLIGCHVDWTQAEMLFIPAKDILRAANLDCLPKNNAGVKKYLDRFEDGEEIDRVLLMMGNYPNPLIVAEGYHRTCACYIRDEKTPVGAFLG